MAETSQQVLLNAFHAAAGYTADAQTDLNEQGLINALGSTVEVINAQTQATSANTDALAEAKPAQNDTSSTASTVTNALNTATQFLGGGLSVMPLISLITSFFGGGEDAQPAALTRYSLPQSLTMESSTTNQDFVWGENGLPRQVSPAASNTPTQITVQVQAMDSQSFLDHSDDIAQAVRKAVLEMNPINDVLGNL